MWKLNLFLIVLLELISNSLCTLIYNSVIGEVTPEEIFNEYYANGSYQVKYEDNGFFPRITDELTVNRTIESLDNCWKCLENVHFYGEVCLCKNFTRVQFYCEAYQILEKVECKNITKNFENLPEVFQNPQILFLREKNRYYGYVKSTRKFDLQTKHFSNEMNELREVTLVETSEGFYELHEVEFCEDSFIESNETLFFMIHFTSLICLFVLICFFACIPETRANDIGKSWCMFIVISFINYFTVIYLKIHDKYEFESNLLDVLAVVFFIIYNFTEFSIYFWISIISYDAYRLLQ